IGVHVVALRRLGRAAVTATVMSDDAVAAQHEEHQLGVPVVGTQRPTVMEHERLTSSPILVEDLRAVRGRDERHLMGSSGSAEHAVAYRVPSGRGRFLGQTTASADRCLVRWIRVREYPPAALETERTRLSYVRQGPRGRRSEMPRARRT